jgi:hypothetical protein
MAQSGKPWHICDDCLDPLAHDLLSIAHRFYRSFDVAKVDRLDAEYRQIQEDSAFSDDRLTDAQRKRRDELLEQMQAQTEPPRAFDVDSLYRQYRIDMASDWLKFNVSVEYAEDFQRTLLDAKKRFSALEFKACQIINGDEGKEPTIMVRYPIQRLEDRHLEKLRKAFPDHESYPDREEMPEDLRTFEVEILDEYEAIGQQIRETGNYLRRVSALVQAKMKKADVGEAAQGDDKDEVKHSDDFRSVRWFGTTYSFTTKQAPVVDLLYKHWRAGTPDVGDETLLLSVDPEAPPARLSTLFRDHPAWGTMIVAGGSKGTHRLTTREKEKL